MIFKSSEQPLCRWCGKAIRKWTSPHNVPSPPGVNWTGYTGSRPTSKAEAQKLTNETIVSISYTHANTPLNTKKEKVA